MSSSPGRAVRRLTASVGLRLWGLVGLAAAANFMLYLEVVAFERWMEERNGHGLDRAGAISVALSPGVMPRGSSTALEAIFRDHRSEDQSLQLIFVPRAGEIEPLHRGQAVATRIPSAAPRDEARGGHPAKSVAKLDKRCLLDEKALPVALGAKAWSGASMDGFKAPDGCWVLASVPASVSAVDSPAYLAALQVYCFAATLIAFALAMGVLGRLRAHARLVKAMGHRRQPVAGSEVRCPVPELEADIILLNRLLIEAHGLAEEMRRAAEDDAHDLKSPLGLVRVAHRRVRRVLLPVDSAKALAALDVADQALDRMVVSIETAQALAEERAALAASPRDPVDVAWTMDQCRRSLELEIRQKALRVVIDQRDDIVLSTGAGLLETLLADVLGNAVEASPDEGEIVVELRIEDGEAVIAVADAGAAICSISAGALFAREPLDGSAIERVGPAPRRYFNAKRSADLLGGAFMVGNQPDGGVLAVVYLPA